MLDNARFEMAEDFSITNLWMASFPHRLEFIM